LGDEVKGYYLEQPRIFWDWDAEQWHFLSVHQVLVLLALRASFNIILDPRPHSWPPEDVCDGSNRLVSSGVSCCRCIVEPLQDLPAELVVRWYCVHAASLPESSVYAVIDCRYFRHLVLCFPQFHGTLVLLLALLQVVKDVQ
jgi:hypothetical protein